MQNQRDPALAIGPAGNALTVWYSDSIENDLEFVISAQGYIAALFCDGFESGNTDAWSNTVP